MQYNLERCFISQYQGEKKIMQKLLEFYGIDSVLRDDDPHFNRHYSLALIPFVIGAFLSMLPFFHAKQWSMGFSCTILMTIILVTVQQGMYYSLTSHMPDKKYRRYASASFVGESQMFMVMATVIAGVMGFFLAAQLTGWPNGIFPS
jgi:hypothetical protein